MNDTKYQKGDMTKTRWKLAMRRWLANQQKRTLKNAMAQDVKIHSMPVTEVYAADPTKRNIVPSNVATGQGSKSGVQNCGDVMGEVSPMTTRDNVRLCAFCFEPFTFTREHAKYCGQTCKTDAYQVRKAFADGRAVAYLTALGNVELLQQGGE